MQLCAVGRRRQSTTEQSEDPIEPILHIVKEEQPDDPLEEHTLPIYCLMENRGEPITVTVEIAQAPVQMEVDTAATLSIMSYATFSSTWLQDRAPKLMPSRAKLRTYTGEEVTVKGAAEVTVTYEGQEAKVTLTIVEGRGPTLPGRDWLQHLRLNWARLNHVTQDNWSELKTLLCTHSALFSEDLGQIKGVTARLYLKEGSKPRFYRARQVPYALRELVAKEIDRQVELGVLDPVRFSPWATPVVPVRKKDGSIRLCGDYRVTVNRETVTETYPLPRVEDLLSSLSGRTAFSKLDLRQAYQQVVLDDEAKEVVTINTHKGLYRVNRLPFGVASAPSIFQRTMENLLRGIPGVLVYLDDMLVTGVTISEHLRNLGAVLKRLEDAGVKLKRDKCSFLLPAIEYLGHHISAQGIQPTTEKVEAIQKAPEPSDVTQLRSFLGAVNYYQKFLPDLSTVLAPLYKLLQRGPVRLKPSKALRSSSPPIVYWPTLTHQKI